MCNNHVYFMFHEFRGWPIQLCLSLHIFLSTWRYCLQRESDERHPAASSRSQAWRALTCWRFVKRMKGRGGASKTFKAWPSPPLVTKVAQRVLRGLWRNLAPLALLYAHPSTFPASAGPCVYDCVCVCRVNVCFRGYLSVFGFLQCKGAMFGLWIHAPQCSESCCVWYWSLKQKRAMYRSQTFHMPPLSCCWRWKFVSISFTSWKHKKTYIATPLWVPLNSLMNVISMVSLLSRCSEKPTNGPQGMRAHAYMINRSITSISASLMWHHNIMSLLLWSGLVISIQGTAAKPAGTSHT